MGGRGGKSTGQVFFSGETLGQKKKIQAGCCIELKERKIITEKGSSGPTRMAPFKEICLENLLFRVMKQKKPRIGRDPGV